MAFPDTWMIRLGTYIVDGADTQFTVTSDVILGTVIDYSRDLGGDSQDTIVPIAHDSIVSKNLNATLLTTSSGKSLRSYLKTIKWHNKQVALVYRRFTKVIIHA